MENMGYTAVMKEAERVYNMKRDFIVPSEKVNIGLDQIGDLKVRFIGDPNNEAYNISENAHAQISQKL